MDKRQQTGRIGEAKARSFLEHKGYRILETNLKISYKELDIIALKQGVLVFVEVRTRTSKSLGLAEETFSIAKTKKLKQAVMLYLVKFKPRYSDIRLDLIVVDYDGQHDSAEIRHYEDIA